MSSPLYIRKGSTEGRSLRVKSIAELAVNPAPDARVLELANRGRQNVEGNSSQIVEGWLLDWTNVGVLSGRRHEDGHYSARFWDLTPSIHLASVGFDCFQVVGFFHVVEVVNNAKMAKAAWEDFVPR